MVFIICISLLIAFVVGYLVVTKMSRRSGKAINPNQDLKPVPPPTRDENYRPKY